MYTLNAYRVKLTSLTYTHSNTPLGACDDMWKSTLKKLFPLTIACNVSTRPSLILRTKFNVVYYFRDQCTHLLLYMIRNSDVGILYTATYWTVVSTRDPSDWSMANFLIGYTVLWRTHMGFFFIITIITITIILL